MQTEERLIEATRRLKRSHTYNVSLTIIIPCGMDSPEVTKSLLMPLGVTFIILELLLSL